MLIKEYRIPLPLDVEEYRIAQLYMIQKKSREESRDTESGVEIIENKPYVDGPGGDGQYTYKIYHIGSHLPGWFRAVLSKSALQVEEEAWNAYPYTKTRYRCPFVDKFLLEIETRYLSDCCVQDNALDLNDHERAQREIDIIDIVRDPISSNDYRQEEDPKLFRSSKTSRGPLEDGWKEEYLPSVRGDKPVMTAYKVCRVEFKYWGMQTKIERFIHDIALRRTMLRAHRQAWCWQDEYHGLCMDDIRQLEKETQIHLAQKMASSLISISSSSSSSCSSIYDELGLRSEGREGVEEERVEEEGSLSGSVVRLKKSAGRGGGGGEEEEDDEMQMEPLERWGGGGGGGGRGGIQKKKSWEGQDSGGSKNNTLKRGGRKSKARGAGGVKGNSEWRYQSLEQLQGSDNSDEEFFDARLPHGDGEERERAEERRVRGRRVRSSSMEVVVGGYESCDTPTPTTPAFEGNLADHVEAAEMFGPSHTLTDPSQAGGTELHPMAPEVSPVKILFLVMHGGNLLDTTQSPTSKRGDFSTLQATLGSVVQSHYQSAADTMALRLVQCPYITVDTLSLLASFSSQASEDGNLTATQDFVPVGAIALFATSSARYMEHVNATVCRANAVYHEFLASPQGRGFTGQVCLVADSTGALLTYDALTRYQSPLLQDGASPYYGSQDSLATHPSPHHPSRPGGAVFAAEDPSTRHTPPDSRKASEGSSHSDRRRRTERSRSEVLLPKSSDFPESSKTQSSGRARHLSKSYGPERTSQSSRRTSSGSFFDGGLAQLDFEVTEFFMLGCPLGLVLAYRRAFCGEDRHCGLTRPQCLQVYNLFHSSDPLAVRLEPLVSDGFKHLAPVKVPRYSRFPLGDGEPVHVVETIESNLQVFTEGRRPSTTPGLSCLQRQPSYSSMVSVCSGLGDSPASVIANVNSKWWGTKRLDYVLYCPDALHSFPSTALTPLFHSSFWESADVVAFILRQVVRQDVTVEEGAEKGVCRAMSFKMTQPREKWLKRRTTIKVRNLQQNHRANDVMVLEDQAQTVQARFTYGALDIVSLTGEKVDVNIMKQPPSGDWTHMGTALTDGHGKLTFTLPDDQRLSHGMYPVKCVVRGDHTSVDLFLTVLPAKTETVVFSIDGSFTASVSIMANDPKVRAGAVDVVRHWQDLGYLILYVSARPDMQQKKMVSWLAQHNFPHGMVAFMDGFSKDPLKQKLHYLQQVQSQADVHYVGAYGSSKDIHIYKELGLQASQIFIVGKAAKKFAGMAQILADGYATHLTSLLDPGSRLRPATGNARLFLRKTCFRLPGNSDVGGKKSGKMAPGTEGAGGKEGTRIADSAAGPTHIVIPSEEGGGEEEEEEEEMITIEMRDMCTQTSNA
ncbi:hypothetical protein ACOMHN_001483 [Nucella lapillus]